MGRVLGLLDTLHIGHFPYHIAALVGLHKETVLQVVVESAFVANALGILHHALSFLQAALEAALVGEDEASEEVPRKSISTT